MIVYTTWLWSIKKYDQYYLEEDKKEWLIRSISLYKLNRSWLIMTLDKCERCHLIRGFGKLLFREGGKKKPYNW